MASHHLPQPVQDALRMEVLSTALCFDNIIHDRQPSKAATLLALVGQFVVEAEMPRDEALAYFTRGYDTFMAMTATMTQADYAKALAFSRGDNLPERADDVLLGLRGLAVIGATSINDEAR